MKFGLILMLLMPFSANAAGSFFATDGDSACIEGLALSLIHI